jgi:hypothetical protein
VKFTRMLRKTWKCWCGEEFTDYESYAAHLNEGHLG